MTWLGLTLSLGILTGCASVTLHPLTGTDIYAGKGAGDVCFSPYYLKEVLKVKIDK